jgi:hypothetical protein
VKFYVRKGFETLPYGKKIYVIFPLGEREIIGQSKLCPYTNNKLS